MFLPKIREIQEALVSFFTPAYTSKFPFKPIDEIPDGFRGLPRYDSNTCVGCGTCVQVCPAGAITMADDQKKKIRTLTVDYNKCMNCGQCEEKCITTTGVQLSKEFCLVVLDKDAPETKEICEKEIVICESCGVVIGCQDQLDWIKNRLGAKAYAHPNLLLSMQKQIGDVAASEIKSRIRREDQIKEVCPKCRYSIVVTDEF